MELRTYEGMFMLDPTKASQEWDNMKKQICGMIERRGGVIVNARKWGEKKLAYEINGHKRATYLLIYFQAPPENISTLKRDLQLSEIVMRTLILVHSINSAKEQQKLLEEKQNQDDNFKENEEAKESVAVEKSSNEEKVEEKENKKTE